MIGELFSGHDFLWTCAWQSTACVVAGLLLSFALRRRPARAHQVLLLAMVAAVAVPTMSVLVRHLDLGLLSAQPVAVEPEKESILPVSTTIVPEISALSATEYVPEPVELVELSRPRRLWRLRPRKLKLPGPQFCSAPGSQPAWF